MTIGASDELVIEPDDTEQTEGACRTEEASSDPDAVWHPDMEAMWRSLEGLNPHANEFQCSFSPHLAVQQAGEAPESPSEDSKQSFEPIKLEAPLWVSELAAEQPQQQLALSTLQMVVGRPDFTCGAEDDPSAWNTQHFGCYSSDNWALWQAPAWSEYYAICGEPGWTTGLFQAELASEASRTGQLDWTM